ncbi:calcium-binding protein [Jannaschia formosa]|uniref:calcium-binding protein n=1 Tax=Jannaschia formosa TaxID=2259592 RepID=UPI000E1B9833|nr:hypothetical protein [Jannaschia formosa]TFL16800.1 hypothetical protein DR046_18090 [Jannaschia formosa]
MAKTTDAVRIDSDAGAQSEADDLDMIAVEGFGALAVWHWRNSGVALRPFDETGEPILRKSFVISISPDRDGYREAGGREPEVTISESGLGYIVWEVDRALDPAPTTYDPDNPYFRQDGDKLFVQEVSAARGLIGGPRELLTGPLGVEGYDVLAASKGLLIATAESLSREDGYRIVLRREEEGGELESNLVYRTTSEEVEAREIRLDPLFGGRNVLTWVDQGRFFDENGPRFESTLKARIVTDDGSGAGRTINVADDVSGGASIAVSGQTLIGAYTTRSPVSGSFDLTVVKFEGGRLEDVLKIPGGRGAEVVALEDGRFALFYLAANARDSGMFGQILDADGKPEGAEFIVSAVPGSFPPVAVEQADGTVLLTWNEEDFGSFRINGSRDETVYSAVVDPDAVGRSFIGGDGDDAPRPSAANDSFFGGAGNDRLEGGDGADQIDGGAGQDAITGGRGSDALTGGVDADRFVLRADHGRDLITDFDLTQDVLVIDSALVGGMLSGAEVVERFEVIPNSPAGGAFGRVLDFGDGNEVFLRRVLRDDPDAGHMLGDAILVV